MSSAKSGLSSCVESEQLDGGMPAAIARRTSKVEEASNWSPWAAKSFKIAALGDAFIANRAVRPYAFGNARAAAALRFSDATLYTYAGVPTRHLMAVSGHASMDTLAGYLEVKDEDMVNATNKFA